MKIRESWELKKNMQRHQNLECARRDIKILCPYRRKEACNLLTKHIAQEGDKRERTLEGRNQ